mmetsp:Transcript_50687/g.162253  ORF Transcript_50687/g.162253 Transcript_50687/m.162253 type:complete len:260 (+) Transcript_50687:121-900(+)
MRVPRQMQQLRPVLALHQPIHIAPPRARARLAPALPPLCFHLQPSPVRGLGRLQGEVGSIVGPENPEQVAVRPRGHMCSRPVERALELIKDRVVLVEVAEAAPQMLVDGEGRDGGALHVNVPQLHRHVVARQDVPPPRTELDVGDRCDDLRKEAPHPRRLGFLVQLGMAVAQRRVAHVGQADAPLAAAIRKQAAVARMEVCRGDHLCEVLHIGRLNVHNVEALVADLQVPEVHPQVVRGDVRLVVAVHCDRVDVVDVRV